MRRTPTHQDARLLALVRISTEGDDPGHTNRDLFAAGRGAGQENDDHQNG
jgi:hypothetical protein